MNTITATELRTKTPELVEALAAGYPVDFIYRSRIIAEIKPREQKVKLFNARRFLKLAQELNLPPLTEKQREKNYRQHIMEKYGKDLPRR